MPIHFIAVGCACTCTIRTKSIEEKRGNYFKELLLDSESGDLANGHDVVKDQRMVSQLFLVANNLGECLEGSTEKPACLILIWRQKERR